MPLGSCWVGWRFYHDTRAWCGVEGLSKGPSCGNCWCMSWATRAHTQTHMQSAAAAAAAGTTAAAGATAAAAAAVAGHLDVVAGCAVLLKHPAQVCGYRCQHVSTGHVGVCQHNVAPARACVCNINIDLCAAAAAQQSTSQSISIQAAWPARGSQAGVAADKCQAQGCWCWCWFWCCCSPCLASVHHPCQAWQLTNALCSSSHSTRCCAGLPLALLLLLLAVSVVLQCVLLKDLSLLLLLLLFLPLCLLLCLLGWLLNTCAARHAQAVVRLPVHKMMVVHARLQTSKYVAREPAKFPVCAGLFQAGSSSSSGTTTDLTWSAIQAKHTQHRPL